MAGRAERRQRSPGRRGGPGGSEKGGSVSASHLRGRIAREGLSLLSLLFQAKGAGEEWEKLGKVWGRSQPGRGVTDTAERSRCGGQGSGAQYVTPQGGSGDHHCRYNVFRYFL